ncbi:MAG: carbohydrate ABC transporter permease [Bifidobacteriaceae bacterium]|jgi:multiple sugar transport system permease protein|nr:carbohydrate ABC transporter permease [Bifidobacteriaceae bacterium]
MSAGPGAALRAVVNALRARRARAAVEAAGDRSIVSVMDRSSAGTRATLRVVGGVCLGGLFVVAIGPLAWLFKAATSRTPETLKEPFALWPSGLHWEYFGEAFSKVNFGQYLANTLWVCLGNWFFCMLVTTTGAYFLAILRPRYAKVVEAAVLATLFIPGVVTLVALYLTVIDVPFIGVNLLNSFWAVWLPAAVSAFNVLLVQRAFAALPRDLLDAAWVDGASKLRVFWSIVLPMSKPILGVVSLLTVVNGYKDFLWPMLVLPKPSMQPMSVALPRLAETTDQAVYMAALFVALAIPVGLFLVFRKQFISAAGAQGAVKE